MKSSQERLSYLNGYSCYPLCVIDLLLFPEQAEFFLSAQSLGQISAKDTVISVSFTSTCGDFLQLKMKLENFSWAQNIKFI
jgi:hypothetical protein